MKQLTLVKPERASVVKVVVFQEMPCAVEGPLATCGSFSLASSLFRIQVLDHTSHLSGAQQASVARSSPQRTVQKQGAPSRRSGFSSQVGVHSPSPSGLKAQIAVNSQGCDYTC